MDLKDIDLGATYRDAVTGFEGVVVGRADYLTGCAQALLSTRLARAPGRCTRRWFDYPRLEHVDDARGELLEKLGGETARIAGGPPPISGEGNDRDRATAASRWHTQTALGGDDVPVEERGDCVRACMTSILGLPINAVENVQGDDWWVRWQEFVESYGFELLVIWPKHMASPPRGLWLCVVPSLAMDGNHCVVAKGSTLFHDPGMKRRYTTDEWAALWNSDRVLEGWLLVPLDPAEARRAA